MSPAHPAVPARPTRFGLAAKLFAILILLGAVAVLITGVLGYVRARDALRKRSSTSSPRRARPRRTRSRPYFRSIRNECACSPPRRWWSTPCAASRDAVDELDAKAGAGRGCARGRWAGTTRSTCRWCAGCSAPTRRSRSSCRSARRPISCRTGTSSTIRIPKGRRKLFDDCR